MLIMFEGRKQRKAAGRQAEVQTFAERQRLKAEQRRERLAPQIGEIAQLSVEECRSRAIESFLVAREQGMVTWAVPHYAEANFYMNMAVLKTLRGEDSETPSQAAPTAE